MIFSTSSNLLFFYAGVIFHCIPSPSHWWTPGLFLLFCYHGESYYAIFIKVFLETRIFSSLSKFPRVEWLSHGVGLCLTLQETVRSSTKVTASAFVFKIKSNTQEHWFEATTFNINNMKSYIELLTHEYIYFHETNKLFLSLYLLIVYCGLFKCLK